MLDEADEYAALEAYENSQGLQQQEPDAGNKRKYDSAAVTHVGAPDYGTAPACPCGGGQCFVEKDREGRTFFVCPAEEGEQCSFRRAVDAMKQSRTSGASMGPGHPAVGAPYSFSQTGGLGSDYQQPYDQQQQQTSWDGGAGGAGGAGGGLPAPNCQCGDIAVLRTSNSSRNPGRQFYGCAKAQSDDTRCRFFKWLDEMGNTGAQGTGTAASQQLAGQYRQQQQCGGDIAAPATPPCICGEPAAMRTSNSARNPGRNFFSCAKPMSEPSRCNFFKWADAGGGSETGGAAAAGQGYGAAGAGRGIGAAAGASSNYGAGGAGAYGGGVGAADGDVLCVCGQPALSRISNSERNPGRKFYKCPKPEGETCNWFKWADQLQGASDAGYGSQQGAAAAAGAASGYGFCGALGCGVNTAAANVNGDGLKALNVAGAETDSAAVGTARFAWEDAARPQQVAAGGGYGGAGYGGGGGGGGGSTDVCYKCNQTGHWARDCPNAGAGGRGGSTGGVGTGVCYKCNQPGHWARDCPNAGGGAGGYGGGGRGSYGGGGGGKGGVCYKCNQPGHWASSCPNNR